jgi:hypothetical protein
LFSERKSAFGTVSESVLFRFFFTPSLSPTASHSQSKSFETSRKLGLAGTKKKKEKEELRKKKSKNRPTTKAISLPASLSGIFPLVQWSDASIV